MTRLSKLLVYSDGGWDADGRMYISYAGYRVPLDSCWGKTKRVVLKELAARHKELRWNEVPLFLARDATLLAGRGELPSNNLAEAKAFTRAAREAARLVRKERDLAYVEFCVDSANVRKFLNGWSHISQASGMRDAWLEMGEAFDGVGVKTHVSWIPGVIMKRTVLEC